MTYLEPGMNSPQHDLSFSCDRRRFLPALLREAFVTLGMLRGGQGGRLSELDSLTDEELAGVTPIVNPAYEILVEDDCVWGRHKPTGTAFRLFSVEERENLFTFNLFNGICSLGEAGRLLSQEMGWDEAQGFSHAREFFLSLVSHLVCLPKDPPLAPE
jgi:hypothetical protein